jgi:hypothetical protein
MQMTLSPLSGVAANEWFDRFAGWPQLALDTRAAARTQRAAHVLTDQYELDSQLAFYRRDIPVNQVNESIRYVSMLPPDQGLLAGTTGLYVASDPAQSARVQRCFDRIEKVVPISRRRRSGGADHGLSPLYVTWLPRRSAAGLRTGVHAPSGGPLSRCARGCFPGGRIGYTRNHTPAGSPWRRAARSAQASPRRHRRDAVVGHAELGG